ncbi:MAG: glycosyltransferase family 2 protein [Gemmatimonadota bacterium]|nr:glycosyltransferase family 2 protein [Gemmatimonadota bacterium]
MGTSIALIISAYNQTEVLAKVLRAVDLQRRPPDEVLVADDGSGADTRTLVDAWIRRSAIPARHLWHADDGFRKTVILNRALAAVTSDYVIFTDADCVPHPRFVSDHAKLAEPGFWVQGRRCFVREPYVPEFDPERVRLFSWAVRGRIDRAAKGLRSPKPLVLENSEQRGILGCNLACWRTDAEAVNGFDEAYSGWGIGEDSDFASRLYHLGLRRKLVYGHAILYHLNHPTLPRDHVPESRARLAETLRTGRVRCEAGLDRHTSAR